MAHNVENVQQQHYPGLTVSRDGDAIVVRIPVRFHRRNGSQMVPEIVERIFDGDESEGMKLAKLRNDWSVAWQEQEWGGQKNMSSVDVTSRRH